MVDPPTDIYDGHRSQEMPEREGKPGLDLPQMGCPYRARQSEATPQAQGPPSIVSPRGVRHDQTARETATPTKGEPLPGRECRLGGTRRDPLSGPYRGKRPIPDGEGASLRTQWGDAQKARDHRNYHTGARTSPHLRKSAAPDLSPSTTNLGCCE